MNKRNATSVVTHRLAMECFAAEIVLNRYKSELNYGYMVNNNLAPINTAIWVSMNYNPCMITKIHVYLN